MFANSDAVKLDRCLACNSTELVPVLDLNTQPLANSYKETREEVQQEFPLAINHCKHCHHVQLTHAVNPDLMFKDYLYVSGTSQTMRDHFWWFANYATEYYKMLNGGTPATTVFDIGCNDGSQLDQFTKLGILTYGIDPAENLHEHSSLAHEVHLGYFDKEFVHSKDDNYDIITAQNVFAHNYDPFGFLDAAKDVMDDNSLLFIQTSQADMIKNNEFDTIYHEHISFYNINSMNELCNRVGLNLIDVVKCPLHGNSYIFVISKTINRHANIENHIDMEKRIGLLSDNTYVEYAKKCNEVVEKLKVEIKNYSEKGYMIVGYGAAAKGMTLLNYSGIDMNCIIDDNPLKQGRFTPGSNIPILSSERLELIKDDVGVVFVPLAWNFFDEIKKRIISKRNNPKDIFLRYFPTVTAVQNE